MVQIIVVPGFVTRFNKWFVVLGDLGVTTLEIWDEIRHEDVFTANKRCV